MQKIISYFPSRGFTLIETLIAVTVLLISITTPLEIASRALFASYQARDEITAYYLASEAIEYVKNVRDTAFLDDIFTGSGTFAGDWMQGLEECRAATGETNYCIIDVLASAEDAIQPCGEDGEVSCEEVMRFDPGSGVWGYLSTLDEETKFSRKITIEMRPNSSTGAPVADQEAVITVTVTWPSSGSGVEKTFVLKGYMTNWQRV